MLGAFGPGLILEFSRATIDKTRRLGSGSFADVYPGTYTFRSTAPPQDVAYKMFRGDMSALAQDANVVRELTVGKNINHENLVQYYGIVRQDQSTVGLVMELLPDGTLDGLLKQASAPLDLGLCLAFAKDIACGMKMLHGQRPCPIIHRDLKAQNVLLWSGKQRAKVADFGLAKPLTTTAGGVYGGAVGTLAWSAPETFAGEYSTKSDVFSYGVVLYEILSRKHPHEGKGRPMITELAQARFKFSEHDYIEHDWDLTYQRNRFLSNNPLAERRPDLAHIVPAISPRVLTELMQQSWADDPEDRPTFEEALSFCSASLRKLSHAEEDNLRRELKEAQCCLDDAIEAADNMRRQADAKENATMQANSTERLQARMEADALKRGADEKDAAAQDAQQRLIDQAAKLRQLLHAATPKVPGYWKNTDLKPGDKPFYVHCHSRHMEAKMQKILRETAIHQGCKGGVNLAHAQVIKVERIENSMLWKNYSRKKEAMQELREAAHAHYRPVDVESHEVITRDINEVFLLHGTGSKDNVLNIPLTVAQHGFDERVSALGGLYGGGCYFGSQSCKIAQYATAKGPNLAGEYFFFYCRVLLGDAHRTKQPLKKARRAPVKPGSSGVSTTYDSVTAWGQMNNGHTQVHREYIVYDRNQIYPEFLVSFKP